MHRLLTDTLTLDAENPLLPKEAQRHLKVIRPHEGEPIELFDGKGFSRVYAFCRGELEACSEKSFAPKPSPELTLFACVTKGSRWDWTIEKATELGVSRIVPVLSDRTIVRIAQDEREAKQSRWMRIAADAARQSDAKWLPEILPAVDFAASLDLVKKCRCFVGALADPRPRALADGIIEAMGEKGVGDCGWGVYIGPEGDFTPDELKALLEIALPADFGPTILRAETAAIFSLSVLKGILTGYSTVTTELKVP